MHKFRFRLDSVLRLRTLKLTVERDKLARCLAEAARLEDALKSLSAERADAGAFVRDEPRMGTMELRALSAYLLGYDARLAAAKLALETAQMRVNQQRQRVIAADRDERLLLKLKVKRKAEWQLEADKEVEVLAQESWNAAHMKRDL